MTNQLLIVGFFMIFFLFLCLLLKSDRLGLLRSIFSQPLAAFIIVCVLTASNVTTTMAIGADCSNWPLSISKMKLKQIQECLIGGADPNIRVHDTGIGGIDNATPLHLAASQSTDPAVIKILVEAGANIDARDSVGDTPLHWAALYGGRYVVVKALLNAGANPNTRSNGGWTPLHRAAQKYNANPCIIRILLNRGGDLTIKAGNGFTPIDSARYNNAKPTIIGALQGRVDKDIPCDIVQTDPKNLQVAANGGAQKRLTESSDDARSKTLYEAAKGGDLNRLTEILEDARSRGIKFALCWDGNCTGSYVNHVPTELCWEKERGLWSALHIAAYHGHHSSVKLLLKAGFDPNIPTRQAGTKLSPIYHAAYRGHDDIILALHEAGANLEAKDQICPQNYSPLHVAAKEGKIEAVMALLALNADSLSKDSNGATPLHLAVENGHVNVVLALLVKKINVDATDKKGNTPLHYATKRRSSDIIRLLLIRNADPMVTNQEGDTPISIANSRGWKKIVSMLKGASQKR